MDHFLFSPYIVPLGAFLVGIVAIVAGAANQAHSRRLKAEQRMAMLARGVSLAEIESILDAGREAEEKLPTSPTRRMANSRRTAMVLISTGLGIALFGIALSVIVQTREVLAVAAVGLIPFVIGLGFLADYSMQRRDINHLGSEVRE